MENARKGRGGGGGEKGRAHGALGDRDAAVKKTNIDIDCDPPPSPQLWTIPLFDATFAPSRRYFPKKVTSRLPNISTLDDVCSFIVRMKLCAP